MGEPTYIIIINNKEVYYVQGNGGNDCIPKAITAHVKKWEDLLREKHSLPEEAQKNYLEDYELRDKKDIKSMNIYEFNNEDLIK